MKLILGILLLSLNVFAGLPPTSLGGGSAGASKTTTFNFVAPLNTNTQVSGVTSRIETGYENILPNSQFEAAVLNWSSSGGGTGAGVSVGTASPILEKQDMVVQTGASGGIVVSSPAITIPNGMQSTNGQVSCRFFNASLPTSPVIKIVDGSANVLFSQGFTLSGSASNTSSTYGGNFVFPTSGTVQIQITDADTSKIFEVDDCYVGPALNLGFAMPTGLWQNAGVNTITATGGGAVKGTTSIDRFLWRQVGSNLEGRIEYTQTGTGTDGTGDYLFAIPASTGCQIDSTKVNFYTSIGTAFGGTSVGSATLGIVSVAAGPGVVVPYDTTHLRLFVKDSNAATYLPAHNGFFNLNSLINYGATFSVPCVGWSASQATWSMTCPFDGSCVNEFSAIVTSAGAITSQNGVTWLSGVTASGSGVYPVTFTSGLFGQTPACTISPTTSGVAESNIQSTTTSGASAFTASTAGVGTNSGFVIHCSRQGSDVRPIYNAPIFIGSITSNAQMPLRYEYAKVSAAGVVSGESSDFINGNCALATNVFTCSFNAGIYSAAPNCVGTIDGATGANSIIFVYNESTTSVTVSTANATVANTAYPFKIHCIGPR